MADGGRAKKAGLIAGLVALGVGAAIASERAVVARDRKRSDPYADQEYGRVRGASIGPVESFDGTPLNVEEAGSGPTLVFSHGFSLNLTLWHHQILGLRDDARLVLYDHRGHGRSGMPPGEDFSLEALACDLDTVVRKAGGDEPVVLVGHSMGGMTALKYCEMFPEEIGSRVAGLILVDTTAADVMGGMLPGVGRRVQAAFQAVQESAFRALAGRADRIDSLRARGGDLSYLGTRLLGFGRDPSPAQVDFVERMLSDVPSTVWMRLVPGILGLDVEASLAAISVPALVIVGERDRLTPPGAAERIVNALPNGRLMRLADVGHTPMLETPDVFNEHVRAFLAHARASR